MPRSFTSLKFRRVEAQLFQARSNLGAIAMRLRKAEQFGLSKVAVELHKPEINQMIEMITHSMEFLESAEVIVDTIMDRRKGLYRPMDSDKLVAKGYPGTPKRK